MSQLCQVLHILKEPTSVPALFFFKAYNNSTKCLGPGIPEPDPDPDSDPGKNTDRIRIRKPDLGHNPLHASGKRSRRNKCSEIVHWFTTKNILKLRLTISRVSASNEPIWWRRKLDRCSLSMVKNWRKEGFIYIHTYNKASSVGNLNHSYFLYHCLWRSA